MRAFEIVVEKERSVFDLFLDGANITSRVNDVQIACVVRDLAAGVLELAKSPTGKKIVHFYDDAYELCIERTGSWALISLYRGGTKPSVVVYDRPVPFEDVLIGVREAITAMPARTDSELFALRSQLAELAVETSSALVEEPARVDIDTDTEAAISFGAEFAVRSRAIAPTPVGGSRVSAQESDFADLHALLFRGSLRMEVRSRVVALGADHPFLACEQLVRCMTELLDAWENGRDHTVTLLGAESPAQPAPALRARISVAGEVALLVGRTDDARASYTFPNVSVFDLGEAVLAFGRALIRGLLRRDRNQARNLRVVALRRQVRELGDSLREACQSDAKLNASPDSYRSYLETAPASDREPKSARLEMRLRYAPRWRALVPGIDLRATFVSGQSLIVGAREEVHCLSRSTGELLWQVPVARAVSVATPAGLARVAPDGSVAVHDLSNGMVALRTWIEPRRGGPMAGAVVHAPNLPRLLVLTEGEKHLVALDLLSGETRWRVNIGGGGAVRMRRAGRLLLVASGQNALSALDVVSGEVVWRIRDRFRFRTGPLLDGEDCYVLAGGAGNPAALHRIDTLSGRVKYRSAIQERHIEGELLRAGDCVVLTARDYKGAKFLAYDCETGASRWQTVCPEVFSGSACIAVDDRIVANTPAGMVVGVDARSGSVVYRRSLGKVAETDTPKRLEPILRSGALFVPHADVHVLRPEDGAVLARVEGASAIPDLLRVDDACNLYMAEESGHLVAFGTAARLQLVQ
jgi:outer membrane protein assembly factor BamB